IDQWHVESRDRVVIISIDKTITIPIFVIVIAGQGSTTDLCWVVIDLFVRAELPYIFITPPNIFVAVCIAVSPVVIRVSSWGFDPVFKLAFGRRNLCIHKIIEVVDLIAVGQGNLISKGTIAF